MKSILATAYAINPYKGSEDGMGWNFVCQIARFHKVIAVTRENNRPKIEQFMQEHPKESYENITFLYFDLPYWMRFWKKGGRGAMLYYLMWQRGVAQWLKQQQLQFDIVHNLNFHNDWTPSFLWKLGKPFVWGSVGHHPRIPTQYLKPYAKKYAWKDSLTWRIKKFFWNASLQLKKTVRKADFICCMNKSVQEVLDLKGKASAIMPSVATEDFGYQLERNQNKFQLISAGRLVPLKGYDLSILAYSKFLKQLPENARKNCTLTIVGRGAELKFYKALCQKEGIEEYVQFEDWIRREDLMKLFKESSAFLFPSHEGAGMVVAEALSFGLPVICLDNCGPGEFIDESCGFAIPEQDYEGTVEGLSAAIQQLYEDKELAQSMRQNARKRFETHFHWDRRGEQLRDIYATL